MDLENATNSLTSSIGEGALGKLFTNPIYASLMITVVVILIILCIYQEDRLIKTGFYVFCASAFVIFVHNKLLLVEHRKQLCSQDEKNICNGIDSGPPVAGGSGSELGYLNGI